MNSLNHIIEEFLDGNLNEKELKEFLKQKEINPDLEKELKLRSEVNDAIRDKGLIELREKLASQRKRYSMNYPFTNIRRDVVKTWHMAAASFSLILVAGGLWYILSNSPYSTEKLVTKYYKPAHAIMQIRSVELNTNSALNEAFAYYKIKDYNNALSYFNSLENQITARFYSGICYIELESYDKAIESFEFVIEDNDNLFIEQADWYLGLIYLMDNQKSEAIKQFEKISASDSYYVKQANDILIYMK
ncbi:MAG: tetratricopeptide repeat protein [Bacteroidales bacterium]|nr:tetratricopeptide repeat protein [Bacteroidales bacterium]